MFQYSTSLQSRPQEDQVNSTVLADTQLGLNTQAGVQLLALAPNKGQVAGPGPDFVCDFGFGCRLEQVCSVASAAGVLSSL